MERIRTLASRYMEGLTDQTEEQELRRLLHEAKALPADLRALTLMLEGFDEVAAERLPARINRPLPPARPRWQWMVAAAAVAVVVVVASHLSTPYCYIDGQPIYDKEEALAYTECLSRLEYLDRSMDIFDNLLKNSK